MKRPALNNRLEEEASDCFSTSAPNSSQANQEETSPYLNNNYHISDTDSLSDDSGKNRKKRNTYQKIPDEIRVGLLDAVKNGETLKSAAKRYKINYSSAKSILHTYRKEGRILKKSAQERTAVKKNSISISSVSSETHMPRKIVKRETNKAAENYNTVSQTMAAIPEEYKPEKSQSSNNRKESNDTVGGFYDGLHDQNQMTFIENGMPDVRREENYNQQPKLFENYHFNNTMNFMENNHNNLFASMPQFHNFSIFSNENDTYHDMETRWPTKNSLPEDHGSFLYMKGGDERTGRFENEMFPGNFMDSNNFFKDTLKHGSNLFNDEYHGRKSSVDFFSMS